METIVFGSVRELRLNKEMLEKRLKVKIFIKGKNVNVEGESMDEYVAGLVLEAMALGFSAARALLLKDENFIFKKINIKDFTRRKNLYDVRARIIGAKGQTLNTIEDISSCYLIQKENFVGIIGLAENINTALLALTNLIRGAKQANVYKYLEGINRVRKQRKFEERLNKK